MEPIRGTNTKRHRRVTRRLAVAAAIVAAMVMGPMQASPASADHPGSFDVTVLDGSGFIVEDPGGNPITGYLVGTAACEDTVDNDADGDIDFPADSGCVSADDENERLAEMQGPFDNPTFNVDIDAAGNVTFDPSTFSFPSVEGCLDVPFVGLSCTEATLVGSGGVQSGFIDPVAETMELDFEMSVEFNATVGLQGFEAPCTIGPISGTLAGEYDHAAGTATIGAEDIDVPEIPATTDCGSHPLFGTDYRDLFNDSLPGFLGILLDLEFEEI